MNSPPPLLNNRYRLVHHIGSGGMASVYLAYDEHLERDIAVKFMSPERMQNDRAVQRFTQEARILARLSHPNIMAVHDAGHESGWSYLVLEYLDGRNLHDAMVANTGPFSIDEAVAVVESVLEALAYAHAHSVIHRDIKPENLIMIDQQRVKVADFGLARLIDSDQRLTTEGTFVGTLLYVAPEQISNSASDGRCDLYSLGAVFYELLAGIPPFRSPDTASLMMQILHDPPVPLRTIDLNVPPAIEAFIQRLMAKTPEDRYPDALTALQALRSYRTRLEISSTQDRASLVARLVSSGAHASRQEDPNLHRQLLLAAAVEDTAEQVESERRRIAALLEQVVIEPINLMLAQVSAYEQTMGANPQARMAISVMNTLTRQLMQQARDFSANLNPIILESLGLEPALEALAGQEMRTRGTHIQLQLQRQRERMPALFELALYRAAQDALFHAEGEGRATQITMRLERDDDKLIFSMSSNSKVPVMDGLRAAAQRIHALGGSLDAHDAHLVITFTLAEPVQLTERELEVLRLLAEGLSNKEIAAALVISHRTVKFHLDNLYSKLGVNTRTGAAMYAMRQGLLRR